VGLTDLLAVVLGVKTAEALDRVRADRASRETLRDLLAAIDGIVDRDLARASGPGATIQDLSGWAVYANRSLTLYQAALRAHHGISVALDVPIEYLDEAVGWYVLATRMLLERGPGAALPYMDRARSEWQSARLIAAATISPRRSR
jgi:hypothetical protein